MTNPSTIVAPGDQNEEDQNIGSAIPCPLHGNAPLCCLHVARNHHATSAGSNTSLPEYIALSGRARQGRGRTHDARRKGVATGQPALPIRRLNVIGYSWWNEALHGVLVDGTTEFPEPVHL
jgi:hypothetical protein